MRAQSQIDNYPTASNINVTPKHLNLDIPVFNNKTLKAEESGILPLTAEGGGGEGMRFSNSILNLKVHQKLIELKLDKDLVLSHNNTNRTLKQISPRDSTMTDEVLQAIRNNPQYQRNKEIH